MESPVSASNILYSHLSGYSVSCPFPPSDVPAALLSLSSLSTLSQVALSLSSEMQAAALTPLFYLPSLGAPHWSVHSAASIQLVAALYIHFSGVSWGDFEVHSLWGSHLDKVRGKIHTEANASQIHPGMSPHNFHSSDIHMSEMSKGDFHASPATCGEPLVCILGDKELGHSHKLECVSQVFQILLATHTPNSYVGTWPATHSPRV